MWGAALVRERAADPILDMRYFMFIDLNLSTSRVHLNQSWTTTIERCSRRGSVHLLESSVVLTCKPKSET